MRYFLTSIIGYICLDLYLNLIPKVFVLNTVMWLLYALAYFPIAHYVSKLTGMNGLHSLGVKFHYGWIKNLKIGFAIGSLFWLVLELIRFLSNDFSIIGIKNLGEGSFFIVQAFVGMFLGSFINDIIVRGYVFARLINKVNHVTLLLISSLIYSLNDVWYEGFSLHNTIFSIGLGLPLGYVFLRSGSLWANTGIHWGLNIIYCIFYGIPGRESEKGLLLIEKHKVSSIILDNLSIIVSLFMFIFILIFYQRLKFISVNNDV